jgi:hypothetical protein
MEPDQLVGVLGDAGVEAELAAERRQQLDAHRWVEQGQPGRAERAEVLAALRTEADGGAPTGLSARQMGDALTIEHRYVIVAGRRPGA